MYIYIYMLASNAGMLFKIYEYVHSPFKKHCHLPPPYDFSHHALLVALTSMCHCAGSSLTDKTNAIIIYVYIYVVVYIYIYVVVYIYIYTYIHN